MFDSKKPYSAVTVKIENLTSESYAEDDLSGIPDLVEVIKIQVTGPTEAARAIRKKLKYGTVHRQIRALVLLDGLIQNAGSVFQRAFADEPLLERLRVCGTSELSDAAVRRKCTELFREWAQYKTTPGLERVARLHKELPKRKLAMTQERSKVIKETDNPFGDDEEEEAERASAIQNQQQSAAGSSLPQKDAKATTNATGSGSSNSNSNHKKSKSKSKEKGKPKPFKFETEKGKLKGVIADASMAVTGLMNALQAIDREKERVSENKEAVTWFQECKVLRRRILRYIHLVHGEQWMANLLHANDELVRALMTFEQLDNSMEADSDSDDELAQQAHQYRMMTQKAQEDRTTSQLAGLSLTSPKAPARPPRPAVVPRSVSTEDGEEEEEEDDDDDPFGDKNMIATPAAEKAEPRW